MLNAASRYVCSSLSRRMHPEAASDRPDLGGALHRSSGGRDVGARPTRRAGCVEHSFEGGSYDRNAAAGGIPGGGGGVEDGGSDGAEAGGSGAGGASGGALDSQRASAPAGEATQAYPA